MVITGISKGIGKSFTQQMLDNNYIVIGTSRNGTEHFKSPDFYSIQLDLSNFLSIEKAHKQIVRNFSKIDILINNAGVGPDLNTPVPAMNTFNKTLQVNLTGTIFFTEALINRIVIGGKIINVSSKMGSINSCSSSDSVAYRISKTVLNVYSGFI